MRSYGGAFIASGVENLVDANIRTGTYVDSKTTIAQRCRLFVKNGDTLFLDNSTTSYYIAKELQDMSTALVESSKMRTRGCLSSVRAMQRRCFCPPETFTPP